MVRRVLDPHVRAPVGRPRDVIGSVVGVVGVGTQLPERMGCQHVGNHIWNSVLGSGPAKKTYLIITLITDLSGHTKRSLH